MLFPTRGIKDEQTRSFRVGSFLVNITLVNSTFNWDFWGELKVRLKCQLWVELGKNDLFHLEFVSMSCI